MVGFSVDTQGFDQIYFWIFKSDNMYRFWLPLYIWDLRFKNDLLYINYTKNSEVLQGDLDLKPFSKGEKIKKKTLSKLS